MNTRSYEIMFIVRPDMEETDLDKLVEGFQKNVTDGGGEIKSTEPVIKFITVRMDEEEKRLAKVKALRDTKVKRSAQPVQQAPAPAAPAPASVAIEAAAPAEATTEAPTEAAVPEPVPAAV